MPYTVRAICKAVEQIGDTLFHPFRWRCSTEPAQHFLGVRLFRKMRLVCAFFMLQLSMGYPNRASTAALLKDRHHVDPLSACQTVTSPAELEKLIAEVSNIHVADRIYDYIAELVDLTRSNAYVTLGVSPRGALAVTRAAKANAYLEGRDYVIPDDVCAVFPDVCVHRLILNSKARLQDYTAALILQNVLTSVQKPDVREFSSK